MTTATMKTLPGGAIIHAMIATTDLANDVVDRAVSAINMMTGACHGHGDPIVLLLVRRETTGFYAPRFDYPGFIG